MKQIGLILFLINSYHCLAQIKVLNLDKNSIPQNIKYTGHLKQAVRWTDQTGDNVVILTETGQIQSKTEADDNYSDAALYVYHYLLQGDSSRLTWKIYDFVKECPVDLFLYFIKGTFAVTDLNGDGKAEVWIMYKNSCQGDVSPVPMKVIMYEDGKKYAARGATKVHTSDTEYMGGNVYLRPTASC